MSIAISEDNLREIYDLSYEDKLDLVDLIIKFCLTRWLCLYRGFRLSASPTAVFLSPLCGSFFIRTFMQGNASVRI